MKKYKQYRKPYRIRHKKPIYKNRFFWLGIFVFIFLTAVFYFLFFFQFFQVKSVNISGTNKIPADSVRSAVENKLVNKILFLSTKTIFLVNSGDIKRSILNDFPQAARAEVRRKLPDVVDVSITERAGQAVWCREERCFLLDGEGVIFEDTEIATGTFRLLGGYGGDSDLKLGDKITDKDVLSQVFFLKSKIEEKLGVPSDQIDMVSEERINVRTGEGWEIYFNPERDLNWQLDKLNAVLDKEIPSEKRSSLEYIELRFGNLASYKYR